jgi:taurine dioxygenase
MNQASPSLAVTPLSGAIGAEVRGIDLSRPLATATVAALRALWLEHLVLVFPGQNLDPARFQDVAGRFGTPMEYPFLKGLPGFPCINEVVKREDERINFGGVWHSDTAYLPQPPMATFLLAREVPPAGGDTLFANMYLAYETLSATLRRRLDGLVAINTSGKAEISNTREDRIRDSGRDDVAEMVAEHPVVRTHPETGRKALYVNPAHTLRFKDMTEAESAAARRPLRPPGPPRGRLPRPLEPRRAGVLGQPLRPALSGERLSRAPAPDAPHHPAGRPARLTPPTFRQSRSEIPDAQQRLL